MTAVAAVLGRSQPPAAQEVHRVLNPAVQPGSLAPQVVLDGLCGLGAAVLPFTHEDVSGEQPLWTGGSRVVLAGRLDNRDELIAALDASPSVSDVWLAAQSYQRWGRQCPEHLVGAFALVIWDPGEERLFCATDHLASRALFYSDQPSTIAVASSIRQLLAARSISELDEDFLLASVCLPSGAPLPSERTPYVGLRRLLPGSALNVEHGRLSTWRYWKPEEFVQTNGSAEELGQELLARLRTAVRSQSRTRGRVLTTLSGGLDSSTVTGLLAAEDSLPCQGFETMAMVFGDGAEADETRYRRAAERHFGVQATEVDGTTAWHFQELGSVDEPFTSHAAHAETKLFAETARELDCNVLLYGNGGDELLAGSEYFVADLVAQGHWLQAAGRLRELAGLSNRTYFSALQKLAIGPLRSRRAGIRWSGQSDNWDDAWYHPPAPPWLATDLERREAITEIWRETSTVGRGPYARAHEMSWIGAASVTSALNDSVFHQRGLEKRTPFYDRRVVELALSIPGEQKLRVTDGSRMTKLPLRAATPDVLPHEIHQRRTKGSVSAGSASGISREWSRIWNDGQLEVARRGYVDEAKLTATLRRARMGKWENIAHLTALLVLEFWLRERR